MNNKRFRRILAILLAVLLVLGNTSYTAFADDGGCTDFSSYTSWTDAERLPEQAGNYVLETDVTVKSPWVLDRSYMIIGLCLNGHTITFQAEDAWNSNYDIMVNSGTLSIYDHTESGRIVGDGNHPIVGVLNGSFNLYNGKLTGGDGAVYMSDEYSKVSLYGGEISGNNSSGNYGGYYGGVYVGAGTFSVSGKVRVTGNTANGNENNIYLLANSLIHISGELDPFSYLGVTTERRLGHGELATVTDGLPGRGILEIFTADDSRNSVGFNADGEAVVGMTAKISFSSGEGSGSIPMYETAAGSIYTLPYPSSFIAPAGKVFDGWQINGEGETLSDGTAVTVSDDMTLTAMWKTGSGPITQHLHVWELNIPENDPSYATLICTANGECDYHEEKWVRLDVTPLEKTYGESGGFNAEVACQSFNTETWNMGFPSGQGTVDDLINIGAVSWKNAGGQQVAFPANAGTYTAEAVLSVKSDPENAPDQGVIGTLRKEVTIHKAAAPEVTVTGFTDLPYTEQAQPLLTVEPADLSGQGTVYYRLGEDGAWSAEIPEAAESGEYTVYWYFEGTNYENIGSPELPMSTEASISPLHEHDGIRFTRWSAADSLPTEAGNYFLNTDVTLSADWTVGSEIHLCLNGKTIGGGKQLTVENGGNLTLYADNGGALSGLFAEDGGAIRIEEGGSLTAHGVSMTDLVSHGVGSTQKIGAVTVLGTFIMDGGSITNSQGPRGGVSVAGGSFRISGLVNITGNELYNNPQNKGANVFLEDGSVITVDGALSDGSSIGVRTWYDSYGELPGILPGEGESVVLTSGYGTYMDGVDPADIFTYDYGYTNKRFVIGLENGEAVAAQHKHGYSLTSDGNAGAVVVSCINPYCEFGTGNEYTVTLTVQDAEYDNEAHGASFESNVPEGMAITQSISYYYPDGSEVTPADLSINEKEPYKPGDYIARLTVYEIGNNENNAEVERSYSITEPVIIRPASHVDVVPREGLGYQDGRKIVIADFANWEPEDASDLLVIYKVDNEQSWHLYRRNSNDALPSAYSKGVHTIYYYIPADTNTNLYDSYGSQEEPLTAQATIHPRYTVTFDKGLFGTGSMDPVELIPLEGDTYRYTLPESDFRYENSSKGFAGWKIGNSSEVLFPGEEIDVTADLKLTAQWAQYRKITLNVEPAGYYGRLTASKTEKVIVGEKITLTATPFSGYVLSDLTAVSLWGDPVEIKDFSFTMPDADVTVTAVFSREVHSVTIADGIAHGTVSAEQAQYEAGASVTLTVEPEEYYELASLTYRADGEEPCEVTADAEGSYIFEMPEKAVTVYAEFVAKEYGISVAPGLDHLTIDIPEQARYGETVTFLVYPKTGVRDLRVFVVDEQGTDIPVEYNNGSFSFTMPHSPVTLNAEYSVVYLLWVGGTQVTDENADNILGNGQASFDPDSGILELSGAGGIGSGLHDESMIYANSMDLTVMTQGGFTMENSDAKFGIKVDGGSLTVLTDGDLTINVKLAAMFSWNDISVSVENGMLKASSASTGYGGTIYSSNGSVSISGEAEISSNLLSGIWAQNNIVLAGGPITVSGMNAVFADSGSVTVKKGTTGITADGSIGGIRAGAGVTLEEGLAVSEPEGAVITGQGVYESSGSLAKHVVIEKAKPAFKTQSLILSGQIGLMFYLDLPAVDGIDYTDSSMTFSIEHGTCPAEAVFDPNIKNAVGTYYGFRCNINSVQMAEPVDAVFHYTEDGQEKTIEYTYSVANYFETFDRLVNDGKIVDEEMISLVHSLADYGHFAQLFLAEANDWRLGIDYAELTNRYQTGYDIDAIREAATSHAMTSNYEDNADIEKVTFSLTLDSDTALNVFFKPSVGYSGNFSAAVNGDAAEVTGTADGRFRVVIPGISAHLLSNTYTILVTTENGTTNVSISALSYVNSALKVFADNENAENAMAALYAYSEAANAYMAEHSNAS